MYKNNASSVDSFSVVDADILLAEAPLPNPTTRPSGTPNAIICCIPNSFIVIFPPRSTIVVASRSLLTQALLLRMGQLAYYVDHYGATLEASNLGMIYRSLDNAVTP